jgi:hypothetical protein
VLFFACIRVIECIWLNGDVFHLIYVLPRRKSIERLISSPAREIDVSLLWTGVTGGESTWSTHKAEALIKLQRKLDESSLNQVKATRNQAHKSNKSSPVPSAQRPQK